MIFQEDKLYERGCLLKTTLYCGTNGEPNWLDRVTTLLIKEGIVACTITPHYGFWKRGLEHSFSVTLSGGAVAPGHISDLAQSLCALFSQECVLVETSEADSDLVYRVYRD